MGELQNLGLKSGINAMLIGHYLTTLGQPPQQDQAMLADLSLMEEKPPSPVNTNPNRQPKSHRGTKALCCAHFRIGSQ
jgi:biotin synthase